MGQQADRGDGAPPEEALDLPEPEDMVIDIDPGTESAEVDGDAPVAEEVADGNAESADPAATAAAVMEMFGPDATAETVIASLADDLTTVAAEREEYLDGLRRMKAEFDNFRKRSLRERTEAVDRASEALILDLLEVLDACDAAQAHGDEAVTPIASALMASLTRAGLDAMSPIGKPFDPESHEAVAFEEGDDGEQTVADVMRTGYRWKGRVVRPAMVKVRG